MLSMSKLLIPLPPSNQPTPFTLSNYPDMPFMPFDTNSTFDSGASHVTSLRENARARSMFFVADQ